MDDEKDFQFYTHHLKSIFVELSQVIKRNRVRGLLLLLLVIVQIFCIVIFAQSVRRITQSEKVLITSKKNVSIPDLPVFTFCSKDQYRNVYLVRTKTL